ncbi:hypothetical protein PM082_010979 [Marasmius tenuissimus]|nr:hypothetical protein PM082_010979 [Marasmius tenuissimus]
MIDHGWSTTEYPARTFQSYPEISEGLRRREFSKLQQCIHSTACLNPLADTQRKGSCRKHDVVLLVGWQVLVAHRSLITLSQPK